MFWRLLIRPFSHGLRTRALAVFALACGAALAAAMLSLFLGVGDQVSRELKSYGANILITPRMDTLPAEIAGVDFNPLGDRRYLEENDLPLIKSIFWANNILGFAPFLEQTGRLPGIEEPVRVAGTWFERPLELPGGETFTTGVKTLRAWYQVDGAWTEDPAAGDGRPGAMVGADLAGRAGLRPGSEIDLTVVSAAERPLRLTVTGLFRSGGPEDDIIIVPLGLLQDLTGLQKKVGRIEVSALTSPENDLALKAAADPKSLSQKEFETWYCNAYAGTIAFQLEEALPGSQARPILKISAAEGRVLEKTQLFVLILVGAALLSSGLGVSSLMTAQVMERSREIGLLNAIGAPASALVSLFSAEAALTGLLGGGLGYLGGLGLAELASRRIFGSSPAWSPAVIPVVLSLSVITSLAGSLSAARAILRLKPAAVLRGR